VGRFLSVDPIIKSYPELTPYQFASNSPIENIDIDGLESGSAISAGVSSGASRYSNEKKTQGTGLLRFVTSFEPYKAGWIYIKDVGKSAPGNKAAIQRVSEKTTTAATKFSHKLANSATEPVGFFTTLDKRSIKENISGGTNNTLKSPEFYTVSEIPEALKEDTNIPY
jgi:hypothetical protein